MKYFLVILLLFFSVGCSKIINSDDLILSKTDGLFYEKNNKKPFTGEVTGRVKGQIIKGKREGEWLEYYTNGSLESKSNYKDGKEEGGFISYDVNGRIVYKYNYKLGKLDGEWLHYYETGELKEKRLYKSGKLTIN